MTRSLAHPNKRASMTQQFKRSEDTGRNAQASVQFQSSQEAEEFTTADPAEAGFLVKGLQALSTALSRLTEHTNICQNAQALMMNNFTEGVGNSDNFVWLDNVLQSDESMSMAPSIHKRKNVIETALQGFDMLVDEAMSSTAEMDDASIVRPLKASSSVRNVGTPIRSLAAIRRTAVLLSLCDTLWHGTSLSRIPGVVNPTLRHSLLSWSVTVLSDIDAEELMQEALQEIVFSEKALLTLAEFRHSNERELKSHPRSSTKVSGIIGTLFLLGYWDSAISLIRRCFIDHDHAADNFIALIDKHFPTLLGDEDLSPASTVRNSAGGADSVGKKATVQEFGSSGSMTGYRNIIHHAFHPYMNLRQFNHWRRDVQDTFRRSVEISDDHLLKDLLTIVVDAPEDESEDECMLPNAWLADDASGEIPQSVPLIDNLLATRNSGAESTIINFSTQMFWLNHHFEAHLLTCTAEEMENLYNQKALGYLYQQWRRGRNGSDSSISITDAGAALLLANSSESLLRHLTNFDQAFLPMTASVLGLFLFCSDAVSWTTVATCVVADVATTVDILVQAKMGMNSQPPIYEENLCRDAASILAPFFAGLIPLRSGMISIQRNPDLVNDFSSSLLKSPLHPLKIITISDALMSILGSRADALCVGIDLLTLFLDKTEKFSAEYFVLSSEVFRTALASIDFMNSSLTPDWSNTTEERLSRKVMQVCQKVEAWADTTISETSKVFSPPRSHRFLSSDLTHTLTAHVRALPLLISRCLRPLDGPLLVFSQTVDLFLTVGLGGAKFAAEQAAFNHFGTMLLKLLPLLGSLSSTGETSAKSWKTFSKLIDDYGSQLDVDCTDALSELLMFGRKQGSDSRVESLMCLRLLRSAAGAKSLKVT